MKKNGLIERVNADEQVRLRNLMEQKISYGHTAKARLRSNEDWDVKLMGCKTSSRREFYREI